MFTFAFAKFTFTKHIRLKINCALVYIIQLYLNMIGRMPTIRQCVYILHTYLPTYFTRFCLWLLAGEACTKAHLHSGTHTSV